MFSLPGWLDGVGAGTASAHENLTGRSKVAWPTHPPPFAAATVAVKYFLLHRGRCTPVLLRQLLTKSVLERVQLALQQELCLVLGLWP